MKVFVTILFVSVVALQGFGQTPVKVNKTAREMSKGLQPASQVNIPETSLREAEKAWIKRLQRGSRSRVEQDKQEMKITGAEIEGVQGGTVTVYSRLYADGDDVQLFAFLEIDSVFFVPESDPEKAKSFSSYLKDFALETYRESVREVLKGEERKLQAMKKVLDELRDTEKRNDKVIKENEREIRNLEDAIRENQADEERKTEEIERQKDLVAAVKNFEEERKKEEKELKRLKREKNKLQKQRESDHKKIDRLEDEIKTAERDIRISKERQKNQEKEISRQEEAMKAVERKLDAIQ